MTNWTKEQIEAIYTEGSNIIVSAGAGSGKTAVLSERVIEKLKKGTHINELLILTFTNAAAAEMKDRIRKKIINYPELKEELDLIDSSYITTFDSYALSIVKKYHTVVNVTNSVSIVDDSIIDIKKKELIKSVFEKKYETNDKLFLNLIENFCVKDDISIEEGILYIDSELDKLTNKKEYIKNYINTFYLDDLIEKNIKKYIEFLKSNIIKIEELLYNLSIHLEGEHYIKYENELNELLKSETYLDIKKNIPNKLSNLPKNCEDNVKKTKKELENTRKKLASLTVYEDEEEIRNTIYKTKETVETILEIIVQFDDEINKFKHNNDIFEFIDISKLAIKILSENEEIRNEIRDSFKEIMVDEYQDTNDIQEQFINLIGKDNVYMVGDIKQSIYRFRNANPYIFKTKYDNYSKKNSGLKIDLNKNFRSRNEVLDDINIIFNLIMDDALGGANYRENHQMIFGNKEYVEIGKTNHNNNLEIYSYDYDKNSSFKPEEIEAFTIAKDIKEKVETNYQIYDKDLKKLRNVNYGDFAILTDRKKVYDLYKIIFEYLEIGLSIKKDETISNGKEIMVLKNIIGLLIKIRKNEIDEDFKFLFISVNRSFVFKNNDQDIFNYFINNNFKESDLYTKILHIAKQLDFLTITELLYLIIEEFDFYDKLIEIGSIDMSMIKIDKLIDMATNLSDLGYDIESFYDYLEKFIENDYKTNLEINEDIKDNVVMMTIFKSKGLEFPICYFPGLYSVFNTKETKKNFIVNKDFGIITPYYNESIKNTFYKELYKNTYYEEEISEKIRLFYVALTRAKEKIILITPSNYNEEEITDIDLSDNCKLKYRSFKDFLDSIKPKIIQCYNNINIDDLSLTKDYKLKKEIDFKNNIKNTDEVLNVCEIKINNEIIEEKTYSKQLNLVSKIQTENMNFGTKIHGILELIDFKNVDYSLIEDEFIKEKIKLFLNQEIFYKINQAKIYKEYEFVYNVQNIDYHGVIDLILEYDDHIDIIDYKLKNITDDNYVKQLIGYKEFVMEKTKKITNIYLYSIFENDIKKID